MFNAPELLEDLIGLCSSTVEVAAQSIIYAVRTVCIAKDFAHIITTKIPHSIGDQDVLSDYDGDADDDDNDNDNDSE